MTKYIVEIPDGQNIAPEFNPVIYVGSTGTWAGTVQTLSIYLLLALAVLVVAAQGVFIVKQQTARVIERFGKFKKIASSGLNFKIPFVDRIAGVVDLRTKQANIKAETKTKDNVFVSLDVAVQYFTSNDKVFDSFYRLQDAERQIAAYIYDVVRSEVPKMTLDEVFEKKEEIALAVKRELTSSMDDYGYSIVTALVTDINPDDKVKNSMNEINTQQRLRIAANEKGEAEKILAVKKAEGESESKRLQGEGIAKQRQAIVTGLKQSVEDFTDKIKGVSSETVMQLVLLTQYFDTLKEMGAQKVILLPHSPSALKDMASQIRDSLIVGEEVGTK